MKVNSLMWSRRRLTRLISLCLDNIIINKSNGLHLSDERKPCHADREETGCKLEKDLMERDGMHSWNWWREMISSPNTNSVVCMTDGKSHNCLCREAMKLLKAAPVWQSEVHPRVNIEWERRWCLIAISPDVSTESSLKSKERATQVSCSSKQIRLVPSLMITFHLLDERFWRPHETALVKSPFIQSCFSLHASTCQQNVLQVLIHIWPAFFSVLISLQMF